MFVFYIRYVRIELILSAFIDPLYLCFCYIEPVRLLLPGSLKKKLTSQITGYEQ